MKLQRFETLSGSISQLIKSIQFIKSRKMAEYGLKGTTCLCLCQILSSEEGLTAGELATLGEIDKAQVSRCVNELTEHGFIYRDDEEGRRYKQRYRLTESGREAAEDIRQTLARLQDVVSSGIDDEDRVAFYRVLNTLCENFADLLMQGDI